ncbi:hypothetical protein [Monoglobus pectinilyticus]
MGKTENDNNPFRYNGEYTILIRLTAFIKPCIGRFQSLNLRFF